jgi:E3 ubiquitin-protein ligase RNF38/44
MSQPPPPSPPLLPAVVVELPICSICLETYVMGAILVCGHGFHAECVSRWLHRSRTCPMCRARV